MATKKLSPKKAIRAFCLDCCIDQKEEIRLCTDHTCPLHEHRPFQGRLKKGSETPQNPPVSGARRGDRNLKGMITPDDLYPEVF